MTMTTIFRQLEEHAQLDFSEARMLPVAAYTDVDVLAAESERIFANAWTCVGRTADLVTPGDYLTADLASATGGHRSVIVLRNDDGEIAAFDNVCVHRCSALVDGPGNATRITCPYHAWSYRLDGQLVSAPFMNRSLEADGTPFDRNAHHLTPIRIETWQGFIYATQSSETPPLSPRLAGLTEVVARYRMEGYVPVFNRVDEWDTNWKLLVENFMDAYHIFKVHKNSFGAFGDSTAETTLYPGTDDFAFHVVEDSPDAEFGVADPSNTELDGAWRHSSVLAAVFPTHVMQLQPDWLWYLDISPLGTGRVRIRWSVSVAPEVLAGRRVPSEYVDRVMTLLHLVNSEDLPIVEGIHRSLRRQDPVRGPFSYLERNVYDFDRYIARALARP